jgi:5-methylcytosine-specific restriction endonuclease McrA
MNSVTRAFVRRRARYRCEYCRLPEAVLPFAPFHVDHIIPKKHGGADHRLNYSLACHSCNSQT